jgi:hypothetical protein
MSLVSLRVFSLCLQRGSHVMIFSLCWRLEDMSPCHYMQTVIVLGYLREIIEIILYRNYRHSIQHPNASYLTSLHLEFTFGIRIIMFILTHHAKISIKTEGTSHNDVKKHTKIHRVFYVMSLLCCIFLDFQRKTKNTWGKNYVRLQKYMVGVE